MSFLKNILPGIAGAAAAAIPGVGPFVAPIAAGLAGSLLGGDQQQSNPLGTIAGAVGPAIGANVIARGDWRVAEQMRNDAANRIQGATGTTIDDYLSRAAKLGGPSMIPMGSVPYASAPQLNGVNLRQPWMPTTQGQQANPYAALLQKLAAAAPAPSGPTPQSALAPAPASAPPVAPSQLGNPTGAPGGFDPAGTAQAGTNQGVPVNVTPGEPGPNPSWSFWNGAYNFNGNSGDPAEAKAGPTLQDAINAWVAASGQQQQQQQGAQPATPPNATPSFANALQPTRPSFRNALAGRFAGAYA